MRDKDSIILENLYLEMSKFTPKVRKGWTKNKILRYLKKMKSGHSESFFWKTVDRWGSFEKFKENLYWHGSNSYYGGGLKPSITFSKNWEDGGGGYGQKYWSVSLSKSKKIASIFSGNKSSVSIYAVILKQDAHVIDGKGLVDGGIEDAVELEDYVEDLWNRGIDAVWIGGGEQELCILNPECCVVGPSNSYAVFNMKVSEPTDEDLEKMWESRIEKLDRFKKEHEEKIVRRQEEKKQKTENYEKTLSNFEKDLEDYKNEKIGRYQMLQSFKELQKTSNNVFKPVSIQKHLLLQIAKEKGDQYFFGDLNLL